MKFLSGTEAGRVLKVTGNTTNTLTLDTTDNSPQTVALTTTNFTVEAGDSFEIFAGDTLASIFGTSSTILTGGSSAFTADTVALYNSVQSRWLTYFYSTSAKCWELYGSTANANNTVLYPYCALTITRRAGEPATAIVLTGRVAEVAGLTKMTGSDTSVYASTKYASDVTLSQLQLSNWTQGTSAFTADNLAVWDATMTRFDTYYQMPDSTWRKYGAPSTNQSNFVIPAGTVLSFLKRSAVSGATSFLQAALPYSVN